MRRSPRRRRPGSRSTPVALALWRHLEIDVLVHVDERSGGFLALGAAQGSRPPGCCRLHLGIGGGEPPPRRGRGRRGRGPADRAHRPIARRAARDRRGADDRPVEALRPAVRWFCEVGTHDADDAGPDPHAIGGVPRVRRRGGEPRPGPFISTSRGASRSAPSPARATSPPRSTLALDGARLGAAHRGRARPPPPQPDASELDGLAARVATASRGLIVCGRQRLAPRGDRLARRQRRIPVIAEPTSQLRLGAHDRELVVWPYDSIARVRPAALEPELVIASAICRRRSRCASGSDRSRPARDRIDPLHGWNDPNRPPRRCCAPIPGAAADALSARLGRRENADWIEAWKRAEPPPPRDRGRRRARRRPVGARRARRARRAVRRRRPRLHGLEHADPRPGGLRRGGACAGPVPVQPRRERDRRARLVGDRRGGRQPSPDVDRARRSVPVPRHERPLGAAADEGAGAHRGDRQRRRRDLRVPPPGRADRPRRVRGPVRAPRPASRSSGSPRCTGSSTSGGSTTSTSSRDLPRENPRDRRGPGRPARERRDAPPDRRRGGRCDGLRRPRSPPRKERDVHDHDRSRRPHDDRPGREPPAQLHEPRHGRGARRAHALARG